MIWTDHAKIRWRERVHKSDPPSYGELKQLKSYRAPRHSGGTVIVCKSDYGIISLIVTDRKILTVQRGEPKRSAKQEHSRRSRKLIDEWIQFCATRGLDPVASKKSWEVWVEETKRLDHISNTTARMGNTVRGWHQTQLLYENDEVMKIFPRVEAVIGGKKVKL